MAARPHAYSSVKVKSPSAPTPNGTMAFITAEVRAFWPHPASRDDVNAALDRAIAEIRQQIDEWFTPDPAPLQDMRYPEGRPGWLGEYQPWPCGRCGRQVDDSEQHDCRPQESA